MIDYSFRNSCNLLLHLLMSNFHLSKNEWFSGHIHLSEIISEVTYEILVITYTSLSGLNFTVSF